MSDIVQEIQAAFGKAVAYVVVFAIALTAYAFVTQALWAWFVAPVTYLPQLTLVGAYGIGIVSTWFTWHYDWWHKATDAEKENRCRWWQVMAMQLVYAGFIYAVAWTAHILGPVK